MAKKHKHKVILELTFNQAKGLLKAAGCLGYLPKKEISEHLGDKRLVGPALIAYDILREEVAEADGRRLVGHGKKQTA